MPGARCAALAFQVRRFLLYGGNPHTTLANGESSGFLLSAKLNDWRCRGFASQSQEASGRNGDDAAALLFPLNRLRFHYENVLRHDLLAKFNYNNIMEVPKVEAVVVVGKAPLDAEKAAKVAFEVMCGQKSVAIQSKDPALRVRRSKYEPKRDQKAVRPIARTTLRGDAMYNFLEKVVTVTAFHDYGSSIQQNCIQLTLGTQVLRQFPEIVNHYEVFEQVRGVNMTVITTAKTREETANLWSGFLHRER